MLPWTHPSPTKWHLDRFSPFCTAHNRESLYFTMGCHAHSKLPIRMGRSGPHRSLGPPYSAPRTACRSVQRLFAEVKIVTDRPTDRQTTLLRLLGHTYVRSTAMRRNNNNRVHLYSTKWKIYIRCAGIITAVKRYSLRTSFWLLYTSLFTKKVAQNNNTQIQ